MATHKSYNTVGVFSDRRQAETAIEELRKAGFALEQIGVAFRMPEETAGTPAASEPGTRLEETAALGAAAGAGFGALAGAVATGLIPGVGPAVAASLLSGILGGTVLGVAAGGLVGALVGLGLTEEEAQYYDRQFLAGSTVVAVRADDRAAEAAAILQQCGAYRTSTSKSVTRAP